MPENPEYARLRLRKQIIALRDAMTVADRHHCSIQITKSLLGHPLVIHARRIFLYCSFRSEVATDMLMHRCLEIGKEVCVPLAVPKDHGLIPVSISDPGGDLQPGYLGIPEPSSEVAKHGQVAPSSIEVAVLPGSVFDHGGNRLGYGAGFYDRFLTQAAPQATRVGLGFSLQLVDSIPVRLHDMPLDLLITEREILTWRR